MAISFRLRPLIAVFGLLLSSYPISAADAVSAKIEDAALPKSAEIASIAVHPEKVALRGSDDAAQLIVTATLTDGRKRDLTSDATYAVEDGRTARVTTAGRVIASADGASKISIRFSDKTVSIPVQASEVGINLPINFGNQIVPIFSKLGCSSGGCHGKAAGQNGFKLSLLGFDPDLDYMTLVKEGRGRRLMPTAPDNSLFLLKATGTMAHGGGRKMEVNSDEYRLVRRWIAAGMPYGSPKDPTVTKISIYPPHSIMTRQSKQQFAVYAHYSDNTVEDITRRAQYESNDQEIATVETGGTVRTLSMSGEAAIMARFQGYVATFRATVPLNVKSPDWQFPAQTVVDTMTAKKWKELGLVPSELCTDEQFIRRASLDLTGTLPTPKEVLAFVADQNPAKRDLLIDDLVAKPEFAYYFAAKWADILRVKRGKEGDTSARAKGTFAFHGWIREAIASDKPYDEFVREILSATGDESRNPPTVWYKDLLNPEQFVDDTAQVFLGLRIACAQCHHHPYEKWSQDDYWGMAAFFGRVGRKQVPITGGAQQANSTLIYNKSSGSINNKRTSQVALPKALDAEIGDIPMDEDPRIKLVDWMVDVKNPFFARAVANRYWAHFFGRGIVDPLDDMRVTNPPSNPELLDALAKNLTDSRYSLKTLVKTICKSRTYQLSSIPNEFNKHDKQSYARYYPKRMSAEVLLDAVSQVTESLPSFNSLPSDKLSARRAIMLPDESFNSYFLDVFGRPQRISSCECERVSDANLAQSLHMLNSEEIQGKLTRGGGRVDTLTGAKDLRPDTEKVEELFLWVFGRKPSPSDMKAAIDHIGKNDKAKKTAYENILWALINTKEFVFNQ